MATSNGALTLAQGANAITAAAGVLVAGILTPQQLDAETGSPLLADSSDLALFADGTPNYAQGAQTINAAAAIPVIGEIAEAQAAQTINAQASVTAAGALEATQAPNSLTSTAGVVSGGTLALTQGSDSLTASGASLVDGSLSTTQGAATLSAAGGPIDVGALTATGGAQTIAAQASVKISGTLAAAQAQQTAALAGGPIVAGSLTQTEGANIIAATAGPVVMAAVTSTQEANVITAAGMVDAIVGAADIQQGADTLAGSISLWQPPTNIVCLPKVARIILIPSEEQEMLGAQPEPPAFDPMDPDDEETFTFDWSQHANPGDTITSATIVASSTDLISQGSATVVGLQVQATYTYSQTATPRVYGLRCSVTYQSNRKGHWTIPLPVQWL